jgi:hypothetical protein
MKQVMIKFIGYVAICLFTSTAVQSQDNNSSINEELKSIWNNDNKGTSGIYSNGLSTENLPPVGGNNDGSVSSDLPIDGGLSLLLAAGVVAGARRIRREVNKLKESDSNPSI